MSERTTTTPAFRHTAHLVFRMCLVDCRVKNKTTVHVWDHLHTYSNVWNMAARLILVQSSCLNAAKPIELWWSVGWVHLSDSASWRNGFRQLSCTAGKSDLICSDRWTQNCTSARVTLHSTTATPETAGASLKPRSNRNHLMRAGVYLCLLNFKARWSLYTHKFNVSCDAWPGFCQSPWKLSKRCEKQSKEYSPDSMRRCSCSSC